MPSNDQRLKDRVIAACYALQTQLKPNVLKTAREFNAPYTRVRRRFQRESESHKPHGGHNKLLDEEEEAILRGYIDFCEDLGLPLREKSLPKTANNILRRRHS
jgi:hypothetical protein